MKGIQAVQKDSSLYEMPRPNCFAAKAGQIELEGWLDKLSVAELSFVRSRVAARLPKVEVVPDNPATLATATVHYIEEVPDREFSNLWHAMNAEQTRRVREEAPAEAASSAGPSKVVPKVAVHPKAKPIVTLRGGAPTREASRTPREVVAPPQESRGAAQVCRGVPQYQVEHKGKRVILWPEEDACVWCTKQCPVEYQQKIWVAENDAAVAKKGDEWDGLCTCETCWEKAVCRVPISKTCRQRDIKLCTDCFTGTHG